jgi:type I restriction enzyme R subunit
MSKRPIFREDESSQIPALQLLQNMGFEYLTPEEALSKRGGSVRNVILEDILEERLKSKDFNRILHKGEEVGFGDSNISNAIYELKKIPFEGLQTTSEKIFDLLTLGKSYNVTIKGDRKSYDLRYIDWDEPANNVYHVTEEFIVESHTGNGERRIPDLVLFVNGIPLVIIECKRTDIKDPVEEAVSQHIRNQENANIPNLYVYSQVLLSVCPLNIRDERQFSLYATTGTPRVFWYPWIEDESTGNLKKLTALVNKPLDAAMKDRLFADRFKSVRGYFDELEKQPRQVTSQDQVIFGLCQKERLLELIKKFILFDGGAKKIARYQQYFSVKQAIDQIAGSTSGKNRPNGVVWHTQGSGKSLSMVMLAKALVLDSRIKEPKVVLITDRIELDEQISKTFRNCGVGVNQAESGEDLIEALSDTKASIVATTLQKFDTVANSESLKFPSKDIILLVDEAHRSQYGEANSQVHKVFPNACFVGYTGTPLTKKERNTMERFGPFIGKPYTNRDALRDKAVVPLLYEGRLVNQDVPHDLIDRWFERLTEGLSREQKADLKKKYNRANELAGTDQRLFMIASDISQHFSRNWKGKGFKGLLAADSIANAMKYKDFFRDLGEVDVEVIISKTDDRKGHQAAGEEETALRKHEREIKEKYGDHKRAEKEIKKKFDSDGGPDILIVVAKLLTGFDAQRTTVLYVDKQLKEHTLLQAAARVNRTFPNKDFGFIIDYHGNLNSFIEAIKHYDKLAEDVRIGYAPEEKAEIESSIHNIQEEIAKLPQYHADLVGLFSGIKNKLDLKEYETALWEKQDRAIFYERLGAFGRSLHLALSSFDYYSQAPAKEIDHYKAELKFFDRLKFQLKDIFSERIDYRDYEPKIEKLLNTHVMAKGIETVVEPVAIWDVKFQDRLKDKDAGSQAMLIMNATNKYITENLDRDKSFYEKFSKLIQATLEEYRAGRLKERELLTKALEIKEKVLTRTGDDLPESLAGNDAAKAFFGVLKTSLSKNNDLRPELMAKMGLEIDRIISEAVVVDWVRNTSIQNKMKNLVEDYLIEIKSEQKLEIDFDQMDRVLEEVIKAAKLHRNR